MLVSPQPTPKVTSSDIHRALKGLWPKQNAWVCIKELRVATGYASGATQFIDAWFINCWPSNGVRRISVEIKVSKGDFKDEMAKPLKRMAAYRMSNELYLAVPKGLVMLHEVPPDMGLVEVDAAGVATITLEAPWHDGESASWLFVASLVRNHSRTLDEQP